MSIPQGQFEIDAFKDKHKDSVHNRSDQLTASARGFGHTTYFAISVSPKAVAPDASSQLGAVDS